MDNLLCVNNHESFFGKYQFQSPSFLEEYDITPEVAVTSEYTADAMKDLETEYPPNEIGAILCHDYDAIEQLIELNLYKDTPLCMAAHTVPSRGQLDVWRDIVMSDYTIYSFAGSIRTARIFAVPEAPDYRVVITPIMGRALEPEGRIPDAFERDPDKEYDIGYISALSGKKGPHRVLRTANSVATELDRTLNVWIGGNKREPYLELLQEIIDSDLYPNITVDLTPNIQTTKLVENIQKSRVMYLPLIKPSETTCYAAWESVAYDVPVVGADWAGVGEAVNNSRHPQSRTVPVKRLPPDTVPFSDEVIETFPDLISEVTTNDSGTNKNWVKFDIDDETAHRTIADILESPVSHTRKLEFPEPVHAKTTAAAFADVMQKPLTEPFPDCSWIPILEKKVTDVMYTENGYALLRKSRGSNLQKYQTSLSTPPMSSDI